MEKKRRTLDQLSDAGQDVISLLQSPEAQSKIEADTEELAHRWDNLVQRLEDCSFQVCLCVPEVSSAFKNRASKLKCKMMLPKKKGSKVEAQKFSR